MEQTTELGALGVRGNYGPQERLAHYLSSGRAHHAILICGPKTPESWQMAKRMAKVLLAETGALSSSAGSRVEKEIHPDLLLFPDAEGAPIKVETIRQVIHQMEVNPIEAHSKVCLIENCHRMTKSASNAFLKTLEEPHSHRYFILLTDKIGSLLPTIISRCLRFNLEPELAYQPNEQDQKLWQTLLEDPTHQVKEKPQCVRLVNYRQTQIRDLITSSQLNELTFQQHLQEFEALVSLEGKLRSNASHPLLMESFMREFHGRPQ